MSKPTFDLHLVGYELHQPEDFRPDSDIGAAFFQFKAAMAAMQAAGAALEKAQSELREIKSFIASAGPRTDRKRFGEARDSAELLARSIPQLEAESARASQEYNAAAQAHQGGYYGHYTACVTAYNEMVSGGLDYRGASGTYFPQWANELRTYPIKIAEFETQLIERNSRAK